MRNLNIIKKEKNSKGITLVALVITIIILLILAAVTLSQITDNGILSKAKSAVDKYNEEGTLEQIKLAVLSAQMKNNLVLTTENLNTELQKNFNDNTITVTKVGNTWYYDGYSIDENGNVKKQDSLLPQEFKQLEYIESTGTQYIDSKVPITSALSFECKWLITDNSVYGLNGAYYYTYAYDQKAYCFGCNPYGQIYMGIGTTTNTNYYSNSNVVYTTKGNNSSMETITNTNSNSYTMTGNFRDVDLNFYLFAAHTEQDKRGANYLSKERIYYCKLYNDTTLIRNFVPCKSTTSVTNSDGTSVPANTAGLYDLVEGKFYSNKSTNENDFIAGPNV